MSIINVLVIKDNILDHMESYIVSDDKSSKTVTMVAESRFITIAKQYGFIGENEDIDDLLENGYYEFNNGSVCISWTFPKEYELQINN